MEPPSEVQSQPLPSKEAALVRRYKPIWRLLLISNFALGGYIFAQARKKKSNVEDNKASESSTVHVEDEKPVAGESATPIADSTIYEEALFPSAIIEPEKIREPIPDDQQRELLKWILEEKRKLKPQSHEEKKRIDEEKALLKRFIRSDSIPEF